MIKKCRKYRQKPKILIVFDEMIAEMMMWYVTKNNPTAAELFITDVEN